MRKKSLEEQLEKVLERHKEERRQERRKEFLRKVEDIFIKARETGSWRPEKKVPQERSRMEPIGEAAKEEIGRAHV